MSGIKSLAIGGYPGSGKTSLSQGLAERGFEIYSGSSILRSEALKTGYVPDGSRDEFMQFWKQISAERGKSWLSDSAFEQAGGHPFVFDGLRIKEDADNFKNRGVTIAFIEFDATESLAKIANRQRSDDSEILTEDDLRERKLVEDSGDPFSQSYVRGICDIVIPPIPFIRDEMLRAEEIDRVAENLFYLARLQRD